MARSSGTRLGVRLVAAAGLAALSCREAQPRLDFHDGAESVYGFLSEGTRSAADLLLQDRWDLGRRFPSVTTIANISWTEDPFDDQYWRFLFYSLRPTTHLLQAYYTTGLVKYREKLTSILRSYADYDARRPVAPYDRKRFDYPHAAAFRALVLVNTVGKLERTGDIDPSLDASLRDSIARIGAFLAREENFETYNHGFTEAAALALIARNYPHLPDALSWQATALQRLDKLMDEAIDADGVEVENSPFYHYYVLGFANQIDRWARTYDVPLSPHFEQMMERMVRYATYAMQPDGFIPELGASVELGVDNLDPAVFGEIARRYPEFDFVYSEGKSGVPPSERAVLFPVSGQAVLRSGFGTGPKDVARETHVMVNVGPWRTKHSHLDVLGITYYSDGQRLLCDSGLFTYEAGADKDYFYGTRAHNTVVVDGGDQEVHGAVAAGLTMAGDGWAYQSGWHELYAGVIHQRSVLVLARDALLVVDTLAGDAPHDYAQTWHVPVGFDQRSSAAGADALAGDGSLQLAIRQALPEGLSVATAKGATSPMQGWISAVYGQKEPAYAIEFHANAVSLSYVTLIASGARARANPSVLATVDADGTIHARACAGDLANDVVIAGQASPAERVEVVPAGGPCS